MKMDKQDRGGLALAKAVETAYAQVSAIIAAEKQRTNRYFPVVE